MPGPPRGIYPAIHRRKRQRGHASGAEIGPAIGVDRLPVDVARARAAQEPHHRRDVFRPAPLAGDGPVGQMMRRFRLVLGPRRADQAGNDAIDGDAVVGEVMGQRAGETDDARPSPSPHARDSWRRYARSSRRY